LLCSVAISGASGQLTDPNLSQLAATIATSCQTFGQQGDAALRQLSSSLSALAVVNPAVQPAVAALVTSFNQFGSSDVPFGSSLIALAKILTFFGGG
jgi:hypothetical protein